jgi:transcriptional regulator with XRE-family HTH domain
MANTPNKTIGRALKSAREAAGLTQEIVAKRACLSVNQIKQIEDGGSRSFYSEPIKLASAKRIGSILGLTEGEFLEG